MACNWQRPTTVWKDGVDGIHFTDPIQGYYPENCYFFAALSSIALVQPRSEIVDKTPLLGKYSVTLYDPNNPGNLDLKRVYKVTPYQCLDASGGYPFGHSKTPYSEMWPALLEKAYGAYKTIINNAPMPSGTLDKGPDLYSVNWPGNGINALKTLTGSSNSNIVPPRSADIITHLSPGAGGFGSLIGTYEIPETNKIITSYQVTAKMLAWTYLDSPNVNGYEYNLRIGANHTFTILGMNVENSGPSYVVLRDPSGENSQIEDIPKWGNYSTGVNGIICVELTEFVQAFEAYGWVL